MRSRSPCAGAGRLPPHLTGGSRTQSALIIANSLGSRTATPFAAGADHYGVADLEALARDTHKFESRYLDGLIGPYPQARAVYIERSPIQHVDQLTRPLIVLLRTATGGGIEPVAVQNL